MGVDYSLDANKCYPIVLHSPYWVIICGFITSTIIQLATYVSGHGLSSWIKSFLRCKCCRKKIYDLSKTNNWDEFPKIIKITSVTPFKSHKEASGLYGTYMLMYDNDNKPYYRSRTPTSENQCFYELRYLNKQLYTGWALIVNEEQHYKYDMIQIDSFDSFDNDENTPTKPELEQVLLLNMDNTSNTTDDINSVTSVNDKITLQSLDKKRQNFRLFPKTLYKLSDNFWKTNVAKTKFEQRERMWDVKRNKASKDRIKQSDFHLKDHFILFRGFSLYFHNILKNKVLDINGKYILESVEDNTGNIGNTNNKEGNILFNFVHFSNKDLTLKYVIKYSGSKNKINLSSRTITLKHKILKIMAKVSNTKGLEFKVYQNRYNKEIDILLRIEQQSKLSFYFCEIITIILTSMILWQYIHDIMYFIRFINLKQIEELVSNYLDTTVTSEYVSVDTWMKYECYGYILTNSVNMKQYIVFLLCWLVCGDSFYTRKFTFTGRIFLALMIMHMILLFPIFITHYIAFYIIYIWLLFIGSILVAIFVVGMAFLAHKMKFNEQNKYIVPIILAALFYIIVILFPVLTMSRYYSDSINYCDAFVCEGYTYWTSFSTVFSERHTSDYIDEWEHKYYTIQQFLFWIF